MPKTPNPVKMDLVIVIVSSAKSWTRSVAKERDASLRFAEFTLERGEGLRMTSNGSPA